MIKAWMSIFPGVIDFSWLKELRIIISLYDRKFQMRENKNILK